MLLAELLGDDLKNSLYAKIKDYYTEGSKDDKIKDIDLGKMLTGLVDFAYEGISEDSKSMDDDSDKLKRYRKAYPEDKRSDSEILQDLNDDKTYKI